MTITSPPAGSRGRIDRIIWRLRQAQAKSSFKRYVGRYVAITGSCGKTTTTTLVGELLGAFGPTTAGSIENANLWLFRHIRRLRRRVDFLVQEVSGFPIGTIETAVQTYRVDVAVVTAVGLDHGAAFRQPNMGVIDAIALEKGKLVEGVAPGGFACLNFDDPLVRAMASRTSERVIGFGCSSEAAVRAVNVEAAWPNRLSFDLVVGDAVLPVSTRFVGTMMLTNILGALAVVQGLGLDLRIAIAKLATIEPVRDRMGVHAGADGKTYILDTQKAPYWSTELLLADLPRTRIEGLTFVLGDMSDIRSNVSGHYRKLIRRLAAEVRTLVLVGRAAEYGAKVRNEGISNIVVAPTAHDVAKYLDTRPPGVVLLKANQTSQLWRVLEQVIPAEAAH